MRDGPAGDRPRRPSLGWRVSTGPNLASSTSTPLPASPGGGGAPALGFSGSASGSGEAWTTPQANDVDVSKATRSAFPCANYVSGLLSCGFGGAPRGIRTNRQIRSLVFGVPAHPSVPFEYAFLLLSSHGVVRSDIGPCPLSGAWSQSGRRFGRVVARLGVWRPVFLTAGKARSTRFSIWCSAPKGGSSSDTSRPLPATDVAGHSRLFGPEVLTRLGDSAQ
jgi:hypothetical protein